MNFDFMDFDGGISVDIDLAAFEGADVIIAVLGDRYVDYSARPGIAIRSFETQDNPDTETLADAMVQQVRVFYDGGDPEIFCCFEAAAGIDVRVVNFEPLLPGVMHGDSGVIEALDAVAGEVLQ